MAMSAGGSKIRKKLNKSGNRVSITERGIAQKRALAGQKKRTGRLPIGKNFGVKNEGKAVLQKRVLEPRAKVRGRGVLKKAGAGRTLVSHEAEPSRETREKIKKKKKIETARETKKKTLRLLAAEERQGGQNTGTRKHGEAERENTAQK